uniref:Ig-like domain-containing protein n=1 Tax=Mastacembelus armatus TaxID=205130 RepID=A0A7N8YCX0_9TELE
MKLCLCAGGSSDTLVVTQISNVSVIEGGTVNISCCWTGSGESQRLRVIWLKNLTEIKNEAVNLTSPPVKKERNDCWNLTFSSVTKEATGRYICRVTAEIPVLASANGSGTVLTVTSRGNTVTSGATDIQTPIIAAVTVMALLLLLTLTCYCSLRRKQGTNQNCSMGCCFLKKRGCY